MWTWDSGEDECTQWMEHYVRCDVCLRRAFTCSSVPRCVNKPRITSFHHEIDFGYYWSDAQQSQASFCMFCMEDKTVWRWAMTENFWAVSFSAAALSRTNLWTHRFFPQDPASVCPHRRVSFICSTSLVWQLQCFAFYLFISPFMWHLPCCGFLVFYSCCVSACDRVCVCVCACRGGWSLCLPACLVPYQSLSWAPFDSEESRTEGRDSLHEHGWSFLL